MDAELGILDWFFALFVPFVGDPGLIAAVSVLWLIVAIFLTLRRKRMAWPAIVATIAWAAFAVWEQHCTTMGYNIRVDLMLIYPLLLVITIGGIASVFSPNLLRRKIPRRFSLRSLLIATTLIALALGALRWLLG